MGVGFVFDRSAVGVRLVVDSAPAVWADVHVAVSLVVVDAIDGAVDWDHLEVRAKSVALGVWVREHARLQDSVIRELDARHQVARREGSLLDLGEVVVRVSVENELAYGDQGVVSVWPYLSDVGHVVPVRVGVLLGHHLDVEGPRD